MVTKTRKSGPANYRPIDTGGGSVKGAPKLSWTTGVLALYKIIMQRMMENDSIAVYRSREFGGPKACEPVLLFMKENHPEAYEALRTSRGDIRTKDEMLGVLYDRGHKGFYANEEARDIHGRPRISPEHYSQSQKLAPRVEEAERVLAPLLRLSRNVSA